MSEDQTAKVSYEVFFIFKIFLFFRNKARMEKMIRKINIMKKLIRNFIAVSSHMLKKEPLLLEMLKNNRELINVETIMKMSQNNEEREKDKE